MADSVNLRNGTVLDLSGMKAYPMPVQTQIDPNTSPGASVVSASLHAESDRTAKLIAAAYDLLEQDGLEGLTIRAVLSRTGLARRAFYDRFGGKDDLVLAVFEQTLRQAAGYFQRLADEAATAVDALREIVNGIVMGRLSFTGASAETGDRRSAALAQEHLRLAESHPAELQAALSPLLDLIAQHIERGIAAGELRPCDPALAARLVYNLVSTTVHTQLLSEQGLNPDPDRRKQLAAEIWEFCRRALIA